MKIQEISIFGEYNQPENRVTAAFLQICKVGGESLIRYYLNRIGISIPNNTIEIETQIKEDGSIPDGRLSSKFTFDLFVESKVKANSIDMMQLSNHKKALKNANDYLLYITPDKQKPKQLREVYWANWEDTFYCFDDYLQTIVQNDNQILDFLIQNFNTLLDNMNLLGNKWNMKNENVIVLAGSWAESIALKYHYYICQNNRSFRAAKYLAFFNNDQINYVFEIDEVPQDSVDLSTKEELRNYINEQEPEYSGDLRKIVKLKKAVSIGPIRNDKIDRNGNPCPYTYGQPRYTTFSKIKNATRTSDL